MAKKVFLTEYTEDADGLQLLMAGENIEAESWEEAEKKAKDLDPSLRVIGELVETVPEIEWSGSRSGRYSTKS